MGKRFFNDKVILHCDVNNFYASVECASRPELKGKPVAVSGNPKTRTGIILAKNDVAKSQGVKTGESIYEAKLKCPSLICLPPHFKLYEKISNKIISIYYNYTDTVESFGIDECWLDVTGSVNLFGSGKKIADSIRKEVLEKVGVTISVGVSFSKLFAKLGSDLKKPFATTVISRENFKEIVYPLPVNAVIGIGNRTLKKLEKMNVLTLGDYVQIPDSILKKKFNIVALQLKQKLLGEFDEQVVDNSLRPEVKSVGNGTTTITDITKREDVFSLVQFLSEKISKRLSDKNLVGSAVHVSLKTTGFERFRKSQTFLFDISRAEDIANCAMEIIDSFWNYTIPLRSVRLSVRNLKSASSPKQVSIFDEKLGKKESFSRTIKAIKERFGEGSIELASVLKSKFINKDGE